MKNKLINNQKGAVIVTTALTVVVIMGFAALAVDVGYLLTGRNQLQNAVDAAALSGASGLLGVAGLVNDQSFAINNAVQVANLNMIMNNPLNINSGDVSFPNANAVSVNSIQTLNMFFARVLGINTMNVSASATASLLPLIGTRRIRPFAVPELAYQPGDIVTIKAGLNDAPYANPSFYYPVTFPPVGSGTPARGSDNFQKNITNGLEDMASIGDQLMIEPGTMAGPTIAGINQIMNSDPYASWNGSSITNSDFPGFSSPRIITLPMFDTSLPPEPGRSTVTISNFGAFFVHEMVGKDVLGVFMGITTTGQIGGPGTTSNIYSVRLTN